MPEAPDAQHRRAVMLLSVAAFASAAAARLCDPLLPDLARSFATTPTAAASVISSFAIAYGLTQALFGPLGDRLGKYRLIALTTLLSTIGALGSALAWSLDALVVARILLGATAAGIIPLAMAWIGDTVHYEQRQATLARFMGGQILGAIGGQFIGGLFADTLSWRWAFAFLASLYLVIGAIVLLESRANPSTHHRHANTPRKGIVGQAAQVFAQPWARVILSIVFLEGMLVFGALAFVPSYLHERFGLSLTMAGAAMAFFGIGGLTYILAARHFVRRLGEVGLATGGGILIALGWAMLARGESWLWALPASYFVGLGFYMLHNTLQTNATQMAPAVRGTAVSLFASSFFLGQSLGVMLAAHILSASGIVPMLLIAAVGTPLVGGTLAWLLHRHHKINVS